jgi:uncharacterized pyridoxamine 5'-phosphate oxidase family protein
MEENCASGIIAIPPVPVFPVIQALEFPGLFFAPNTGIVNTDASIRERRKKMAEKKTFGGMPGMVSGIVLGLMLILQGCGGREAAGENGPERADLSLFLRVLQEHPNGVLANRNGKKLRTQIITFQFAEGNKAYFCTNSEKPLYKQLRDNPSVSYCTFPADFEPVLSINGRVVFSEDPALKLRAFEGNPYVKKNFQRPDNPVFCLFYIEAEEIETYGSEGPRVYAVK